MYIEYIARWKLTEQKNSRAYSSSTTERNKNFNFTVNVWEQNAIYHYFLSVISFVLIVKIQDCIQKQVGVWSSHA